MNSQCFHCRRETDNIQPCGVKMLNNGNLHPYNSKEAITCIVCPDCVKKRTCPKCAVYHCGQYGSCLLFEMGGKAHHWWCLDCITNNYYTDKLNGYKSDARKRKRV